jgi:predicted transcriptional regulator
MTFRAPTLRSLTERASNDPQRMRARKTEAKIMEMMPANAWLSCTAVSRLIDAVDERRTRARLDRLVRDGEIERRREERSHGLVYLYRRPGTSTPVVQEAAQLRALIADLRQTIRNFTISIETKKDRALDIRARRDNLLSTIANLETYLNALDC